MPSFEEEFEKARIALVEAKHIKMEFDTLFYDEKNNKIVKETAINFFELIYTEFRESLVVKLCKLSDPACQGRNKNLTAEYLLDKEEVKNAPNYQKIADIYTNKILPLRKSLNWYRNKYAVHSNLETLRKLEGQKPSDKVIMDFFEAINDFYNEISIGVFGVTIMPGFIGYKLGAGYLIRLLEQTQKG